MTRRRSNLAFAWLLTAAACASPSGLSDVEEAKAIRDAEPIPFRIGVAPVTTAPSAITEGELRFAFDESDLRSRLCNDFAALRTASEVVAITDEVDIEDLDLVLRPHVRAALLAYDDATQGAWLSSILWITTWFGGLWIEDSSCQSRLQLDWEVVNPREERSGRVLDSLRCSSEQSELAFLERNSFFSWQTLQSLIIPPAFTSDSDVTTASALSRRAVDSVAASVARYLKGGLGGDGRDLLGELRLDHPRNGSRVAASTIELSGRLAAGGLIRELAIYAHDANEPLLLMSGDALPPPSDQQNGSLFQLDISNVEVPLQPGANHIRLYFRFGGANDYREISTSRTVLVHRLEGEMQS